MLHAILALEGLPDAHLIFIANVLVLINQLFFEAIVYCLFIEEILGYLVCRQHVSLNGFLGAELCGRFNLIISDADDELKW